MTSPYISVQSPTLTSEGWPDWMFARGGVDTWNSQDGQKAREVWDMLQKAKRFRDNWAKHWDRYWMMWESEQWRKQRPMSLHQSVVNIIFSSVETFVSHIAEDVPPSSVKARTYEHKTSAELLTKLLLYAEDVNDADTELTHALRSAAVTGVGWQRVDWSPDSCKGRGDVAYRTVDEKFVFTSPHCRRIPEASYIVEAKNVPREFVTRTWPDLGNSVPPGIWDATLSNVRVTGGVDRLWDTSAAFTTTDGSATQQTFGAQQTNRTTKDLVTLIEAWIRQEDGTLRYLVVSNGIVLQDGPSPYDDEDFPYVAYNLIPTLDCIYGRSLVQFIERLQNELNFLHSYALDYQEFTANKPLVIDIENVHEGEVLTNEAGAIFINQSTRGRGYDVLDMGGADQGWIQMQQQVIQLMDSVLGRVDVLKGERPPGVNTLGGLEIIRDEANVRIARMVKWVMAAKRRLSLLVVSRLRQFMKDERVFRISGPMGQEQYVQVNKVTSYGIDAQPVRENAIPEEAEYDVDFSHDAPGGKQAAVELALALAKTPAQDGLPMVDRRHVLETAYEDSAVVSEIMTRMDQVAQQQQQMAAAQAQAQSAAQGQGAPQEQEQDPQEMMQNALAVLSGHVGPAAAA